MDGPILTGTSKYVIFFFTPTGASAWRGMNTPSQCHFLMYANNLSLYNNDKRQNQWPMK